MFRIEKLNNKITLALEEIPFVRSVSFGVFIRNGSRDEDVSVNGISHFIEHTLFKGTGKRTAKQIADEMDAVGGQLNAYTSKEYTCFYARTLDSHFGVALDIISDMIKDPNFDEAEIAKERNVILEEINMVEDSPEELVHDLLEYGVFGGKGLALPVLGGEKVISSAGRDVFTGYYEKKYHPENTVIAVAGNFNSNDIIEMINAAFGDFTRESGYVKPEFSTVYKPCVSVKEKETEQVHISVGFPSIKAGTDEAYPMLIMNTVLGGGMSSRLFQTIREEHGLSYAIYSHNVSFADCGVFSVNAALAANQVDQALTLILKEINRFFTDRIDTDILNKTKEQIKSNYVLSLESSSSRMSAIGRSQLMLDRILAPEEILNKVDAVTIDSVYELAEKVFAPRLMSVAAVGDITKETLIKYKLNERLS